MSTNFIRKGWKTTVNIQQNKENSSFIFSPTKIDTVICGCEIDIDIATMFTSILSQRFANGFRIDSPIELSRFRALIDFDNISKQNFSDDLLKHYIMACGVFFDGKVYIVNEQVQKKIYAVAYEYFDSGAQTIFHAIFYKKNEEWLFPAGVVSENMMITLLKKQFPTLFFTKTFFGYTRESIFTTLEKEIVRIWGEDVLLNYEQISKRLPYIPMERIKYSLGQNPNFIYNTVGTFTHINKIEISEDERKILVLAAIKKCDKNGYISLADLPIESIVEHNNELSITAIHNSIFRLCFADKYDRRGKIITRKGTAIDAFTIMKDYCQTLTKCTLNELLEYERELTGEVHRWIPMEAANAKLVRIDKENYVQDGFVDFDVENIDNAISQFVDAEYLPLKSFTTFSSFPNCGQVWNLFLLESFCRRFSKSFRFNTPSVNSRNAGVVIRNDCTMTYIEILIDAVVHSGVILDSEAIGKFLYENGYTGRSSTSKMSEIIDRAKILREGGD